MSFAEACCNTAIGYFINLAGQLVFFPLFGIHVALSTNLQIGAAFTGISVARTYFVRRAFDWWHARS